MNLFIEGGEHIKRVVFFILKEHPLFQSLNLNAYNLRYLFCDFDHLVIKLLQIFYYNSYVYIFALL